MEQLREAQARLAKLQEDLAAQHPQQQKTQDKKPTQKPRDDAPLTTTRRPPLSESLASSSSCLGGDAFASVSVSKWAPPSQAKLEDIQQWTAAKDESDNAIRTFPRGGKDLRAFVHQQVTGLRLLRHNLFCALAA